MSRQRLKYLILGAALTLMLVTVALFSSPAASSTATVPKTSNIDREVKVTTTTLPPTTVTTVQVISPKVAPRPRAATPVPAYDPETLRLAVHSCEGGYTQVNSSGHAGAYQYAKSTWNNWAGYPTADVAPADIQDQRARYDISRGWGQIMQNWSASYHCWKLKI